jgi:hypothetical protein
VHPTIHHRWLDFSNPLVDFATSRSENSNDLLRSRDYREFRPREGPGASINFPGFSVSPEKLQ